MIEAEAHTIPAALARAVERFGDRPWMAFGDEQRSFARLGEDVDRIAAGLVAAGVEPGDGVGLFLGNGFEWLEIEYSVCGIGAWLVPLNTWFRSRELNHILRTSELSALVWGSPILGADSVGLLEELVPELAEGGPGEWHSERYPALRAVVGAGDGPFPPGVMPWDEMLRAGDAIDAADLRSHAGATRSDDPALVMFTSGTTGAPKGARLSHGSIVDHMRVWTHHLDLRAGDRSVMASPLFWTFGCTVNALVPLEAGSMIALLERFEAGAFVAALLDHRCTHLQGVPSQYELALAHPSCADADLSRLRLIQIGGSSSAEGLARRLLGRAPEAKLISAYGLTEAGACATWTELDDPLEDVIGTVGHVSPDLEWSVRDVSNHEPVEPGEIGELWLRGAPVMLGYVGAEDGLTDGWLRTGDLVIADERGYLRIAGRAVDAFKRGGMNVYPAETEALLMEHPDVRAAAIVGVPDKRLGEVGAAYVVPAEGAQPDPEELIAWCAERLARYKVPAHVRLVESLPLTPTGKVTKYSLRARWDEEQAAVSRS